MTIRCRVPLRIDLAGGWSDIPPFARREGGAVVSIAITQYVTGTVTRGADDDEEKLRISYGLDLPAGAGLGSSAALSVAWLTLVRANMGAPLDRPALARAACELAGVLGITGGKQDEYASVYGGANLMRFGDDVRVEPIALDARARAGLEARLVLCYCGRPRLSGDIHDRVWGAYERGDTTVAANLRALRDLAFQAAAALRAGDFAALGTLIARNWEAQKQLHPSISDDRIERLFETACRAGAAGGKACGAGGGGCIVFLAEPDRVPEVQAALRAAGARLIDAAVDWDGVVVG